LAAQDGAEAVELHRRFKADIALVVLDIRMPKLNGWDAFQAMKKEDPQLKVLFATAYATPEVRSGMARGELHGVLIKPVSIDIFLARVSEIIRESQKSRMLQSEARDGLDPAYVTSHVVSKTENLSTVMNLPEIHQIHAIRVAEARKQVALSRTLRHEVRKNFTVACRLRDELSETFQRWHHFKPHGFEGLSR
jgi:DNA-binding response OmpR family regulator